MTLVKDITQDHCDRAQEHPQWNLYSRGERSGSAPDTAWPSRSTVRNKVGGKLPTGNEEVRGILAKLTLRGFFLKTGQRNQTSPGGEESDQISRVIRYQEWGFWFN